MKWGRSRFNRSAAAASRAAASCSPPQPHPHISTTHHTHTQRPMTTPEEATLPQKPAPPPSISTRAAALSPPSIEDVLDRYASLPHTSNLAMGVAHWVSKAFLPTHPPFLSYYAHPNQTPKLLDLPTSPPQPQGPPPSALRAIETLPTHPPRLHGYGSIGGNEDLGKVDPPTHPPTLPIPFLSSFAHVRRPFFLFPPTHPPTHPQWRPSRRSWRRRTGWT